MFSNSKLNKHFKLNSDLGILILRIFIGLRLLYGVIDNIMSWEKMLEFASFLEAHYFPFPTTSAVVSVFIQFICGLCLLLGFKVRKASILLVLNFIIAIVFVHIKSNDTIEGMTPALSMLFGSLTLFFTGAGNFSINVEINK